MEQLVEEFAQWKRDNDIHEGMTGFENDTNELLLMDYAEDEELLTGDQRTWLHDFIERWDRQQELVDRIAKLRKLGATV